MTGKELQLPPAKRQRMDQTEEAAEDRYVDIKAHALMLCARSAYFDRALSGEWAEAAQRRVELTVKDEQELEDLQLLIKLSYTDSYTHNDGQLLRLATRLRLTVRADALEIVEAVHQVVASLPLGLDFAGALACLDELPPALEAHAGMGAARLNAAAVLCAHLGPVAGMYMEEADPGDDNALSLREQVKQLPPRVVLWLLGSDALQLQLENEAYALLLAWLQQSPHMSSTTTRLVCFKELAPLLRYHHMTMNFLANVVCRCSLMQESGLGWSIMHSAIVQRDALPSLLGEKTKKRNRGVGPSSAKWELKAGFTQEEVAALEPGKNITKWCGLVAGYSARLRLKRSTDEGDTLGAFFGIFVPDSDVRVNDRLAAGVGLKWTMTLFLNVQVEWESNFFSLSVFWGRHNVFTKPWAEAVREGSPQIPGGKMEVKATVKLAVNN